MKKRYAVFVSGVGLLALITGVWMGKAIFSPAEEKTQPAQAEVREKQDEEGEQEGEKQEEAGREGETGTGQEEAGREGETGTGQEGADRGQTGAGEEGVGRGETGAEQNENQQTAEQNMLTIYDIEDGYMQVPYLSSLPRHTYDWKNLHQKDGRTVYIGTDGSLSKTGIDVSYFQEQIDWNEVKKSGIDFVMLRLGYRGYSQEGKLVVDEKFHQYIKEAQAAGLDTGVYFFSQAVNEAEAREEADFVYGQCSAYELTYPVVFDTEKIKDDTARTDELKPEELTDLTIAFCEKIKEYGYEPMIYANAKWLTTKLQLERLEAYQIWYADYQKEPLYPYWFDMWQYTETGRVPGIEGNVDLNIWFGQGGKR